MSETINDRIQYLVDTKFNKNKSAFARAVGLSEAGMSSYLGTQRRSKPNVDMVSKIIKALNVDARWLLLGHNTPRGDHYEQHGDHTVMAKKIQTLNLDTRKTLELEETEYVELPTENHKDKKPSYEELETENSKLKDQLLEAKSRIIELMDERK